MAVPSASAVIAEASLELAADVRELAWIAHDQARRADAGSGSAMIGDLRRAALAEASALERLATALTARPSSRALELASGERAARAHAVRARQAVLRELSLHPRGNRRRFAMHTARKPGRPAVPSRPTTTTTPATATPPDAPSSGGLRPRAPPIPERC